MAIFVQGAPTPETPLDIAARGIPPPITGSSILAPRNETTAADGTNKSGKKKGKGNKGKKNGQKAGQNNKGTGNANGKLVRRTTAAEDIGAIQDEFIAKIMAATGNGDEGANNEQRDVDHQALKV
ncbi:MAG: hypothetical protein M1812_002107 [Candelaria pacifica]|nr:MAG: hypothetical protein M1812_002107 [Candelaria pacifica]